MYYSQKTFDLENTNRITWKTIRNNKSRHIALLETHKNHV